MQNSFSTKQLDFLFQTRTGTDISHRREGMTIEFRENFHLSNEFLAKTAKTMAAFANNRGGYLIFGVTDKPHTLKGMTNDKFQVDPNRLSQFLSTHFQPAIYWEMHTHTLGGKSFGLIYVYEVVNKPVVASCSFDGQYREGEILYRYVSESKSIKAADLISLIAVLFRTLSFQEALLPGHSRSAREACRWNKHRQRNFCVRGPLMPTHR